MVGVLSNVESASPETSFGSQASAPNPAAQFDPGTRPALPWGQCLPLRLAFASATETKEVVMAKETGTESADQPRDQHCAVRIRHRNDRCARHPVQYRDRRARRRRPAGGRKLSDTRIEHWTRASKPRTAVIMGLMKQLATDPKMLARRRQRAILRYAVPKGRAQRLQRRSPGTTMSWSRSGGAGTLLQSWPSPYKDIWDPLRPHLRRLRPRPLHVGHRLDAGGGVPDLQGRGRRVPHHRPPDGQ